MIKMAIIPRIAIQNYMDETGVDLGFMSLILSMDEAFLEDYLNKRIKKFPAEERYKLMRLGVHADDILQDTDSSPLRRSYLILMAEFLDTDLLEEKFGLNELERKRVLSGANEFLDIPVEKRQFAVQTAAKISPSGMKKRFLEAVETSRKAQDKANSKLMRDLVDSIVASNSYEVKTKTLIELDKSHQRESDLKSQITALEEENRKLYEDNQRLRQENYDISRKQAVSENMGNEVDRDTIYALQKKIDALSASLAVKNASGTANCSQFYEGELDLMLTELIEDFIENNPERQRRIDLLREFLTQFVKTDVKKNQAMLDEVRHELRAVSAWNDCTNVTTLGKLSLVPVSSNMHVKLCVNGDSRYTVVAGLSPSDNCAPDNAISYFMKHFT